MAMTVVGRTRVAEFAKRHADAAGALSSWLQTVVAASWSNPAQVKLTYGSADPVVRVASGRRVAVFNIKGNKYRLIAGIDYGSGVVNVVRIMTHSEYSQDKWKDSL